MPSRATAELRERGSMSNLRRRAPATEPRRRCDRPGDPHGGPVSAGGSPQVRSLPFRNYAGYRAVILLDVRVTDPPAGAWSVAAMPAAAGVTPPATVKLASSKTPPLGACATATTGNAAAPTKDVET